MATTALSAGIPIEPVELVFRQECHFKAKACKVCGLAKTNPVHQKKRREDGSGHAYSRTLGCAKCGKFKKDRDHLELAKSLNVLGSGGGDLHVYVDQKERLEAAFIEELDKSGLPRGLQSVVVECHITFGDQHGRDEGNIRFFLEKALGDALITGHWLPDDTFYPVRHYTFGGIQPAYDPTVVAELRLMIFPELESGGDELVLVDDDVENIDVDVAGDDAEHDGVGRVASPHQLTQLG